MTYAQGDGKILYEVMSELDHETTYSSYKLVSNSVKARWEKIAEQFLTRLGDEIEESEKE